MIGPGVGPSFYSGVPLPFPGATFGSNFTTSQYQLSGAVYGDPSLIPGWTFTRASTGYAETVAGTLTSFASGAPRITDRGLLVEEARTNLILQSQEFDNASWTKTGATISANGAVAPDGTTTADKLVPNAGSSIKRVQQDAALTNAAVYTQTVYAKAGEWRYLFCYGGGTAIPAGEAILDLQTGLLTKNTGSHATVTALANGWYRLQYTFTATSTASDACRIGLTDSTTSVTSTGDGTSGIYIWGAQLEAGAFPTSYIPTTTASATRAADDAFITGLSVLDGFTYVHKALAPAGVSTDARSSLNDGSSNNQIRLSYAGTTLTASQVIAGVAGTAQTGTAAAGATLNSAVNSLGANVRASVNGGAVAAAAVGGSMPTLNRLDIGKSAGAAVRYWNAYIRQIIIYPTVFTDAQLIAASA